MRLSSSSGYHSGQSAFSPAVPSFSMARSFSTVHSSDAVARAARSSSCQRVVIISKGKVVAVDTPSNLTARLRGSETMYLQIAGMQDEVSSALTAIPGVSRVAATTSREGIVEVEVDSEKGRDIRRELASVVVNRGLGLLELRPMRMSLEDIFLSLTTEETAASTPTAEMAGPDAPSSAANDSEAARA